MDTKTKPEINVDIKSAGIQSAVVYAPLDKALEALTEKGYRVIFLPENVRLRIQQGPRSFISRNGNWTGEGVIYFPNGKPKLVRTSPILLSAKEATQAHKSREEFYPSQNQIDQALIDSIDFPQENIKIPTDRLSEEALTVWAFGGEKEARAYGEFLREAGIKEMPVYAVNKNRISRQNSPFARQIWFKYLGDGSGLGGYARSIMHGYAGRLCGLKIDLEDALCRENKPEKEFSIFPKLEDISLRLLSQNRQALF